MAGLKNDNSSSVVDCSEDPPSLSIAPLKLSDLPKKRKRWSADHLPVDILLLTVEDCEFLACYCYLRDSFKSYEKSIGDVYFGKMGEEGDESLKVALVRCLKGSSDPGGSQTSAKNAITLLRPKATFLVGFCYSPSPEKAQLGDVVISSKLTTDCHQTPVGRYVGNLVRSAADGWEAPLENPEAGDVKVHCGGEILSCSDLTGAEQQCQLHPGAIAVELAGKGLFAAAHDTKMEWLVIKGVCDFVHGSGSTNKSWKTFACVMAASVASNMLRDSCVFEDWPHYGDGELNIKVEVEDLKPKKPKVQTSTIATKNGGSQGVQYQSAAATSSPTEGSVSHSGTEDLQALKTRVLCSIADNYLRETPPKSIEDHSRFQEHLRKMSVNITGFSVGSLLITVKCESLQILEELWTYYSSGHLGEIVQNCFATEKILEEMNLAELKLKTTIEIEEYKARKVYFERNVPRDISAVEESCKSDNPPENKHRRLTDNTAVVESCTSDDPSENKRRRPTDTLAGEGSFHRDDSSNSKRKRVAEPLNVEKCRKQLRSHYDTFSKVKTVPWNDSSSIPINEIYTPLSWVRDERTPSGARQGELEDYTDMFKGKKHHRKPTRMLVYGRPGIGKSTFCKKIAYDWSKALKEILMKFYIFLLIKLRDVCDMEHIRDVLVASKLLAGDGPIAVESLHDYIINNQDKVLLVLDGYDEYSCVKEHSPILEIWRGEQLRDCHVIVTTRQLECDELTGPSHIQFEIHGFRDWKQVRAYAGKFLTSEQDVVKFTAYLIEKALEDLAEIPLLLMMLCRLWNDPPLDGLPTSRAGIYTEFIQTMLNHKVEKEKSGRFQKVTSTEVRENLSILGKFAFDALLEGRLFVRCSELPDRISRTFEKLSEVGLFQIVNTTSLNPEKGAYFIHKSVQEFLAAWRMKEELLSIKRDSMTSLSRLESLEKILKFIEILKFVCELSTEAASAVLHYFASVEKMGSWLDSGLRNLIQSTGDLFEQKRLLTLISHSYFCCSPERRRDLFSTFLSRTKGIMYLDSSQVNIVAKEHLLKSAVAPRCIFFSYLSHKCSEQSYRDLITVAEDVNAVVGSSSGEKKAADFLRKHACRRQCDFYFLKKSKIVLYIDGIISGEEVGYPFPTKMLRELVSSTAVSTQEKRVCDRFQEHDKETASCSTESTVSITGPIPHSLSRLRDIRVSDIARQEVEMLTDILPLVSSLEVLSIHNVSGISDAQLMEALVSSIKYSERLAILELTNASLTSRPTAAIARSLHQAPNLRDLALSSNPLGKGVSVLAQHLSSCPDLWRLWLEDVKMTKEQMKVLSVDVRQNDIEVFTAYHDEKGNVKPEDEWWTRDGIKIGPDTDSEDEHESGSGFDSEKEQESGSVSDLENEQESWSVTDSEDEEESGSVTDSKDEQESDSVSISEEEQESGSDSDSDHDEKSRLTRVLT